MKGSTLPFFLFISDVIKIISIFKVDLDLNIQIIVI